MFASGKAASASAANYIEEVFNTYLYTGNGSTQTITNGIDLSTKGGLTWIKARDLTHSHRLFDTSRGATNYLETNTTAAQATGASTLTAFTTSGFSLGSTIQVNESGINFASWTFREQPKFFDVVTWTGDGVTSREISHALGSVPACIIVKRTNTVGDWFVYHRGVNGGTTPQNFTLKLNTTDAQISSTSFWGASGPNATSFPVPNNNLNNSGSTYVAYLFAHNAGGFGLTGTDNVISCGTYTGSVSQYTSVTLGYEPQWVLVKSINQIGAWKVLDTMRGIAIDSAGTGYLLSPSSTVADSTSNTVTGLNATGFVGQSDGSGTDTYIYIAIRRGPMKVPTSGTSVFGLNARSGTGVNATVTGGAGVTDLTIIKRRNAITDWVWTPRLTGTGYLSSNSTNAETAAGTTVLQANPWDVMDGVKVGTTSTLTNNSAGTYINYLLDRAPGFMDVVCYTGTGSATTINHNLGVAPELMIVKQRSDAAGTISGNWCVYAPGIPNNNNILVMNANYAWYDVGAAMWNGSPTSTTFGVTALLNPSTKTMVAYLFATCAGVSKVGSYTGTGATQTISCGFAARFVLIKRTDQTADWYVWDTARGMVAGTDPRSLPNSTAVELNNNWVYTAASGFQIVTTDSTVNGNGGTYIFLAIA